MEAQIERHDRALTAEDVSALVASMNARAMDRIQKLLGCISVPRGRRG